MEIKAGDIIEYSTFGGTLRIVKVDEVYSDIKNGYPGFDGDIIGGEEKGNGVWGYMHQVTRIVRSD